MTKTNKAAIVIIGLPASGKTTLANQYKSKLPGFLLYDDPDKSMSKEILYHIEYGSDLIISDPYLCMPLSLKFLRGWLDMNNYLTRYLFFENDPEQCLVNAKLRPDKPVEQFIKTLSKEYTIPDNVTPIPVYRKN